MSSNLFFLNFENLRVGYRDTCVLVKKKFFSVNYIMFMAGNSNIESMLLWEFREFFDLGH